MITRRNFLGTAAITATAGTLKAAKMDQSTGSLIGFNGVADDERFWANVGRHFHKAEGQMELSGRTRPLAKKGMEALERNRQAFGNRSLDERENVFGPQREMARSRVADMINADSREIAFTGSATEALVNVIFGLSFSSGDEVVISNQEYPSVRNAFYQRARRDGIVVREVQLPVATENPDIITRAFANAMNDRTRLVAFSHVINGTGQILPAEDIATVARRRDIPVMVDAAWSFSLLPINVQRMGATYLAANFMKLAGASTSAFMYVQQDAVADVYPLYGSAAPDSDNIRKFEASNTYSLEGIAALNDALDLHDSIGMDRKRDRLNYLKQTWMSELTGVSGVVLNTSMNDSNSAGMANVGIEGISAEKLSQYLLERHGIQTMAFDHPDYKGVRINANMFTHVDEVKHLARVLQDVANYGLR